MPNALLDYFQHCFIINLPHRTDRRREVEYELRRIGIDQNDSRVTFFPAVRPEEPGKK